ncbi:hypothetical protein CTheo_4563 [Ceratobasidium theobromae]|uniref:O-methylsterigmatocystin oxidoreductase n=1 Tax=Ceratobasidium theobromae TaxID=1582974 RepID=A0A5N5QL15_9AGAM|nr:hypothetical protein CTheo_4563 [Ceratobasidium theobromae]
MPGCFVDREVPYTPEENSIGRKGVRNPRPPALGQGVTGGLATDGADVVVNDIPSQQDALEQLVKSIEEIGRKAMFVTGDVSKEDDVQNLVKKTVDALGGLDIMVANAGIHKAASILEITDETFDKIMSVNCKGVLYCYRAAAAQMIKQGRGGRIIGASSIWGTRGESMNVAYVTSKFGVRAITQCAALEWGQYNITVNAYAPGLIDTPMIAEAGGGAPIDEIIKVFVPGVIIKRMGQPEEVAALVSFLASEGASYITVENLAIKFEELERKSNMKDLRTPLYMVLTLSGLVLLRRYRDATAKRKLRHPPSPRFFPIIGHLLSIPPGPEHLAYMKLGKELNSDIIFLQLFGYNIIVLNSARAASDLLDKRSALYSDRFCPPMIKDPTLLDWSSAPSMMEYGDTWRHHRRLMNDWLNPRAVAQFYKLQEDQSRSLLKRLLNLSTLADPFERVRHEFFFTMASSMFQLAYGYTLRNDQDPYFLHAQEAVDHVIEAAMFSNFFVNIFPSLSRVPEWFPGAGWKRVARKWRVQKEQAVDEPYEWAKANVATGAFEPSVLSALLQDYDLTSSLSVEERDNRLKELAAVLYAGGTDTSSNVLIKLVAAMVLNPQVQARAQEEIDTALGPNTLPTMSDRERLPYIRNLILEVMRWSPVNPTGLAHMCFQDDNYEGYDIEKVWEMSGKLFLHAAELHAKASQLNRAMSRDETAYKDPEVFNPDRFLDPNVPILPVFGWGRRKCPGVYFAEASLFISVTSLLATFTFSKRIDLQGNEITPKIEGGSNAMVLELKPFDFEFTPRSERHHRLILESE